MPARTLTELLDALNRRQFLVGTASVALAAACSSAGEAPDAGSPDAGLDGGVDAGVGAPDAGIDDDLFQVLEELRAAVRQSPDHLPARAAALVAAKDAQGLFALVRDQVATLPGAAVELGDLVQAQRWGARAALRGASGTPREKAELLAGLLREAGFGADVYMGRAVEGARDSRGLFLRAHPLAFGSDASVEAFAARAKALGYDFSGTLPEVDPDDAEARALAARLGAAIEDASDVVAFDFDGWLSYEYLPVVRATVGGALVVLNPADPAATWDDPRVDPDALTEAEAPAPALGVQVRLQGTYAGEEAPVTLLERSFTADEVAGAQLVLRFLPTLDFTDWHRVQLGDVPAFTPALVVQDVARTREALEPLSTLGKAITLGGDRVEVTAAALRVNGVALTEPGQGAGRVEDVAALELEVDAEAFPRVRLRAWPRDAQGRVVEGLGSTAFSVLEDGVARGATLLSNSATPRFKVLLDVTASQPLEFNPFAAEDFIEALTQALAAQHPGASVEFAESWDDWQVPLRAARGRTPPTHIVWVTDGGMTDALTPEVEAALAAGPQVLLISTVEQTDPLGAQLAALTGGRVLTALQSDPATAQAVAAEISAGFVPAGAPYVLSYDAPLSGAANRSCQLGLRGGAPLAEARYTAPAEVDATGQLLGLSLTVQVGNVVATRRLAGPIAPLEAPTPTTAAELQAARDALLSAMLEASYLSVEGGFPTTAAWLDDLLAARLGKARLFGLLGQPEAEDPDEVEAALVEAGVEIPPELFTYDRNLADTHGPDGITFESGLRCVLARYAPRVGSRDLHLSLDILPTADIATASTASPAQAFLRTLERTAVRAVREGAYYGTSTLSLLAGEPLSWSSGRPSISGVEPEVEAAWLEMLQGDLRHTLAPEDLSPVACWSVSRHGELLGLLPGGLGGGEEAQVAAINELIARVDFVVSTLNLTTGPLGTAGAAGVAAVTLYGQFLARLYASVAIVVATLDGTRLGPALRSTVLNAACNSLKALVGLGSFRFSLADYILGLLFGASNPLNCAG